MKYLDKTSAILKQIIHSFVSRMQNWRLSYDVQKYKNNTPALKQQQNQMVFLQPPTLNKQAKKITEWSPSLRKANTNRYSPFKKVSPSKSKNKDKSKVDICLNATPKLVKSAKTSLESPEDQNTFKHKTSVMTEDSESNFQTADKIKQRSRTIYNPGEKQIQVIITKLKKQKSDQQPQFSTPNIFSTKSCQRLSVNLKQDNKKSSSKPNSRESQKVETKIDDFIFLSQLGRGFNSVVYLARHKSLGMLFAIKIILKEAIKTDSHRQSVFRELKIHSFLKNPNIMSLYRIIEDPKYIYLVMEYASNGTLFSHLKKVKKFNEERTAKVVKDICRGVKHLHDHDIIHRDLKLQNVLMTEGIAKIGDFGCAVYSYCMRKSKIGSPAYLSPEQLNHNFYSNKIDIWSIGIMTYEMLFQATPFDKEIVQALNKGELNTDLKVKFPFGCEISEDAKDFITKCLQKKQNERIDINQAMSHPFLNIDSKQVPGKP